MPHLDFDPAQRIQLWQKIAAEIERYRASVDALRVSPILEPTIVRALLEKHSFEEPHSPECAVDFIVKSLTEHQVHSSHRMYFGLFNPSPTMMGIAADSLVAAFNPQLAAWSHSPFAIETEGHLIRSIGEKFGYPTGDIDGTFTSGGAEANHTALLTALVHTFPSYLSHGAQALRGQPKIYVTAESHHSTLKAARCSGIGSAAICEIPVDDALGMDIDALRKQIAVDRSNGELPFMVIGTAGSTQSGIVDPFDSLADVAAEQKLWLHADAAWGGAAMLVPELQDLFSGIERADSITFDAHKWLSVPMGAGLFLTRHTDILSRTFAIHTGYMPRDASGLEVIDPFSHSLQWSRRFIGLKVFMSLLVAGWDGYADVIRHQCSMGNLLRDELHKSNWKVLNQTKLPVICFVDGQTGEGRTERFVATVARNIVRSGEAWISSTTLNKSTPVLRACITNYGTQPADVKALVALLNRERLHYFQKA
ncbi:MAG: aminotransferase class V-fold PLP-dependent enzyme [candidate division Zixibacteria bacterium]|nr:aminotransferase class V-fold PLP-dependent enzyme [candidate division Zixibacteria bacterium]